jgi:voltage-gated potassium channel
VLLTALTLIGTVWFSLVRGWSIIDAVYMTVITLTTVGFREVLPLEDSDKVFLSVFLVVSVGVFLYGVVLIGELVVRAELGQWWRKQNMNGSARAPEDHFIVCGAGRMGRLLCENLAARHVPFVVIESNEDVAEDCRQRGWSVICDDATDDDALASAGIQGARGLAAALSSDADNLYVVLSSRLASHSIRIVARASDEASARKMERAGANRVVSPYESGAMKMGQLLTNPRLNDFVEIISDAQVAFDLAGVPVSEASSLVGKRLTETDFRQRGVMIVAIRRSDGKVLLAPDGATCIQGGDELFALGDARAVAELA